MATYVPIPTSENNQTPEAPAAPTLRARVTKILPYAAGLALVAVVTVFTVEYFGYHATQETLVDPVGARMYPSRVFPQAATYGMMREGFAPGMEREARDMSFDDTYGKMNMQYGGFEQSYQGRGGMSPNVKEMLAEREYAKWGSLNAGFATPQIKFDHYDIAYCKLQLNTCRGGCRYCEEVMAWAKGQSMW